MVWNIPRFWELDTCFLTKNVTMADVTTNDTMEIEVKIHAFIDLKLKPNFQTLV